jgi:hypothetical protein
MALHSRYAQNKLTFFDGAMDILTIDGTAGSVCGQSQVKEATFTETTGAGTYTATFAIPAGATVTDVIVRNTAAWTATTSASLTVGDDDSATGYFTATDLKALTADTNGAASGLSTRLSLGASAGANKGGAGKFCATAKTITATVVTVGAAGANGRTRVLVEYACPMPPPSATKV